MCCHCRYDGFKQIHPYAKLACGVFAIVLTVISDQRERDERIGALLTVVNDAFDFIRDIEPLRKIEARQKIAQQLIQETERCGKFIQKYFSEKRFGT
jgi:hypothetical protein